MRWKSTFLWNGQSLYYNRIDQNNLAERAIEIPIAFMFLAQLERRQSLLEIGNVLSNYENALSDYLGLRSRRIIDKFEVALGVENIDLMELPSGEKFDAIVCISTVEHVGQGYAGHAEDHDFEAPLKAIAKIYDLLEPGGKALITVPFGKLLDGGWYIQFSQEYLNLLTSTYGIPAVGIKPSYFQRIATELVDLNPRQLWLQTEPEAMTETDYGWVYPYGNGLAVIELTKQPEPFALQLNVPATSLTYHKPISETLSRDAFDQIYGVFRNLRSLNLVVFPDWSASEAEVQVALAPLIESVIAHPDCAEIAVLIDTTAIAEEEAGLLISSLLMQILAESEIEITEEPGISLTGKLQPVQWQVLRLQLHARFELSLESQSAIAKAQATHLPTVSLEQLQQQRAIQRENGMWALK
jgi:SAM-dependent methyltransferase